MQFGEVKRVSAGPCQKSKPRDKEGAGPLLAPIHPAEAEGSLMQVYQSQSLLLPRTHLSDPWIQTAGNGTAVHPFLSQGALFSDRWYCPDLPESGLPLVPSRGVPDTCWRWERKRHSSGKWGATCSSFVSCGDPVTGFQCRTHTSSLEQRPFC